MRIFIASAAVLFSLMAPAHATCVQSDFASRWAVYMLVFPEDGRAVRWVRCTATIAMTGVIRDTTCRTSDGSSPGLINGRIRLANPKLCTFKGQFTLGSDKVSIEHLTLAANKQTAIGVGIADGFILQVGTSDMQNAEN